MIPIPIHYSTDLILPYGIDCADFASAQQAQAGRSRLTSAGSQKVPTIKKCLLALAVVCAFTSAVLAQSTPTPTPTSSPLTVVYELYGTAPTGVPLGWKAIAPDPVLYPYPRPAMLVVHEGGFKNNDPGNMDVAHDLAIAGYLALAIEYRLAPPHDPMNSPRHCCPGQNDVGDEGHYPESKDDMQMAIRAARADSRCNGKVGAIGGSSGGGLVSYWAGTGTAGDDKLDVSVALSPTTDFHDPDSLADTSRANFAFDVMNYVNSTDASDGGPLDMASPYRFVTNAMCPYFIIAADNDTMPLEQFPDMVSALDAAGVTNYQALLLANSREHGFQFWSEVEDDVLSFLQTAFAAEPSPTPTATPAPTPTPTPTPVPPSITTQPADTTVNAGETARFRVIATGTAPLHYQWRKNGVNISGGAHNASYITPPTVPADNGSLFSVVVSNREGRVTSNNAILTVR
jgi:acetyl esterase/lipase